MPAYVILYKFTQQGLANAKRLPERIKQAKALTEQMGGRTIGVWLTMGEFDMIAIAEGPDDLSAAARLLMTGATGEFTTVTLKAFSEDELAQIVSKLP